MALSLLLVAATVRCVLAAPALAAVAGVAAAAVTVTKLRSLAVDRAAVMLLLTSLWCWALRLLGLRCLLFRLTFRA